MGQISQKNNTILNGSKFDRLVCNLTLLLKLVLIDTLFFRKNLLFKLP